MGVSLKNTGFVVVTLFGIALVSCSGPPSDDVIKTLILQSTPDISELKIIKIGKYDKRSNRCIVRAEYIWTSHSAWREMCVTDFLFFKDISTEEWRLHVSNTNVSRKRIL